MTCDKATKTYSDGRLVFHECNERSCSKAYRYKDGLGCCSDSGESLSYGSD